MKWMDAGNRPLESGGRSDHWLTTLVSLALARRDFRRGRERSRAQQGSAQRVLRSQTLARVFMSGASSGAGVVPSSVPRCNETTQQFVGAPLSSKFDV